MFQQIQFGLMALHWLALVLSPECGYPKWFSLFMLPQNFFIFVLFYDFYRKTYNKPVIADDKAINDDLNNNVDKGESSKLRERVKTAKSEILNFDKTISD